MDPTQHTMTLAGRYLRCQPMNVGDILDLAEAMDSGEPMKQVAAMAKLVKSLVVKEDLALLNEVLHDRTNPVTFTEFNEALGTLMKQAGGRSFTRASASPSGRAPTRGFSKVVSLSRGTVREESPPKAGDSVAS